MADPLIADYYEGDGSPDLQKLVDAGDPWRGVVLKATQGCYYSGGSWLQRYWPAVRRVGADRYGVDWIRGCYHYADFSLPPKAQADYFLSTVDRAGGFGPGDVIAVDVERGGQRATLTKQLVIDVTSGFAEAVHASTGMPIILYGGELIRSLGITDHMRCEALWTARYAPTLPRESYEGMGWALTDLWAWQYAGATGHGVESHLADYPSTTPAGAADISAVTMEWETTRRRFLVRAG